MGKVADAIGLVSIRTKLAGEDLDSLTELELKLARVTGGDVKNTVDETTKLFANWGIVGIEPSRAALDKLLKVSQDTGVSVDTLSTSIVGKAGATFREFNVDMGAAASIMGVLTASGISAQPIVMGLGKAFATASKEGKDAKTFLGELFDTLQNGVPGTAAYNDAIATLGTRGFASLSDAVKSGKLSLADFTGSMDDAKGQIDRVADSNLSLGDKFDILKNKALVALEPIGIAVVGLVTNLVDRLPSAIDSLASGISTVAEAFSALSGDDGAQGFGEIMDNLLGNTGKYVGFFREVGDVIITIGSNLADFWSTLTTGQTNDEGTTVEKLALVLRDTVLPIVHEVVDFLRDHWQPVLIGAGVGLALLASPITTIVVGLGLLYARSETFRDALTRVRDITVDVGRWLNTYLVPILQKLEVQVGHFAAFFIERWDKIRGSVETIVKGIALVIALSIAPALLAWEYFGDQIVAVAELAWSSVQLTVETAVRILSDLFDFVTSVLTGDWSGAWDAVKDILGAAVDYLMGTLGNLIRFIIDFFSSLPSNILSALGDLSTLLGPKAWDLITGMLSGLYEKATELYNWFTGLPMAILGAIPDLTKWLLQKGYDLLNGLWDGAKETFDNVLKWFTDMPSRIKGWIGNAASWLVDVGKSVVQGIVDGITNGADAIWNALKQAVINGLSGKGGGGILSGPTGITYDPVSGFSHASGTSYFRGGATRMNEQGGEIVKLPRGSEIIPADLSANMARGYGGGDAEMKALLRDLIAAVKSSGTDVTVQGIPAQPSATERLAGVRVLQKKRIR